MAVDVVGLVDIEVSVVARDVRQQFVCTAVDIEARMDIEVSASEVTQGNISHDGRIENQPTI